MKFVHTKILLKSFSENQAEMEETFSQISAPATLDRNALKTVVSRGQEMFLI